MPPIPPHSPPHRKWLLRVSEVFTDQKAAILDGLGATPVKNLGKEYTLVQIDDPTTIQDSPAGKFVRWNLPLDHSWPCNPKQTESFIEKAAQALFRKFGGAGMQTIISGALDPGASDRYYRNLASNLRGRTLQLFPPEVSAIRDAEAQNSHLPTLFCLVGKEGLFCGRQSPIACHGFHPGGTKFIRQNAAISRAGAKIAESLHHLQLYRDPPPAGSHWLELGASPGGMTAELLNRNYRVTAIDRAPLDPRLSRIPELKAIVCDASDFRPKTHEQFDAILSDMNGDASESMSHVIRLSRHLPPGGLVIFTLKMPGVSTLAEANAAESSVVKSAAHARLHLFARTHLTYNRHEFTLFFERTGIPSQSPNQR